MTGSASLLELLASLEEAERDSGETQKLIELQQAEIVDL
jgi:hypothetical protein